MKVSKLLMHGGGIEASTDDVVTHTVLSPRKQLAYIYINQ
jgi:hypothetical protein